MALKGHLNLHIYKDWAYFKGHFILAYHFHACNILRKNSNWTKSYYNLSKRLFVPYILRGPLTDLPQTWWMYVGGPPICPWGVLFRKGQRLDGSTGHFRFPLYYICASLTPHAPKGSFCFAGSAAESNSAPFAACISMAYVGGPRNCYWGVLFLKGQRLDRSTGQWVTFTILYMIADDARLTPPRC